MTATAHAVVGGAIAAATVSNPPLGLALSFISHPLLDKIPHWDAGIGWRKKSKLKLFLESSADVLLGLGLAFLLFGQTVNPLYLLGCLVLSMGWDVAEAPYWFLDWRFPPFSTVYNIQSKMQSRAGLPFGIITQLGVMIAAVVTAKVLS